MIVYAETNFVLELTFIRDEVDHAETILRMAESGSVQLVLPAYSLAEPSEALTRRTSDRHALLERLRVEIREVTRSRPYVALGTASATFTSLLAQSAVDERAHLQAVESRLLSTSAIVPLTGVVLGSALDIERALNLSPQDAVVFASVEQHAALFVTKNRKDFLKPPVIHRLGTVGCKLLTSFRDAVAYLESRTSGGE